MATIQEARQILTQQQQQVAQQKKQIEQKQFKGLSQAELLRQTIQSQARRKAQALKLQYQKRKSLAEIKKYETGVLQPYETQISEAEQKAKEYEARMGTYQAQLHESALWEQAKSLVARGKGFAARGDPGLWSKVKKLQRGGYGQFTKPTPVEVSADIKAPPGFHTKEMWEAYRKYPGKTHEQIISSPEYQREIQAILKQPETIQEIKQVAKRFKLPSLETYGELYKIPSTQPLPTIEELKIPYAPPETILGKERFSIWQVPVYGARIVEKSYPYQEAVRYTEKKYPVIHKALTYPTPAIVEDLATSTAMFAFFSPVMGTAAFSKLKLKGGRFEALERLSKEQSRAVISKIEKDLLGKESAQEQWRYIKELSKNVKTEEERAGFKILIENLVDKGILKPVRILPKEPPVLPAKPLPKIKETPIIFTQAPTMRGAGLITGELSQLQKQIQRQKLAAAQIQKPAQAEALAAEQAYVQKQIQKQKYKSVFMQKQVLRFKQPQRFIQRQVQRYKQPQRFIPRGIIRPIPPKPKLKIRIPLFRRLPKKKKKIKKKIKLDGYVGEVRKGGEWKKYTSGAKAQVIKKTKQHLTNTLRTSMRVRDVRTKKLIPLTLTKGLRYPKGKGKTTTILIEKKNLRLSTRGEVKELQKLTPKKGKGKNPFF